MPKKINIIGFKFHQLTVLEATEERKRNNVVWKCLCDCGQICFHITANLISGRIQSCGCLKGNKLQTQPGEYGFNKLYKHYQENAENRGYSFSLSKEEFGRLTKLNCWYCGCEPRSISCPRTPTSSTKAIENCKYIYNGLDRVDNLLGYTIDNVVTCCENCNRAKRMMTQSEFILLANNIAKIHPLE